MTLYQYLHDFYNAEILPSLNSSCRCPPNLDPPTCLYLDRGDTSRSEPRGSPSAAGADSYLASGHILSQTHCLHWRRQVSAPADYFRWRVQSFYYEREDGREQLPPSPGRFSRTCKRNVCMIVAAKCVYDSSSR